MTRAAVSIYVDHQEVIQYPVGYVASQLHWADEVWFFCGDAENVRLVEAQIEQWRTPRHRIFVHDIGHKVVTPGDIATARNKSHEFLLEHSSCEWFVVLSADTLPTPMAVETMARLMDKLVEEPHHVPTHMMELYCDVGSSAYGCTLVPRWHRGQWASDGSYFASGRDLDTTVPECLHLGYAGTDQVGRHLAQHARTWSSDGGRLRRELYERDREAFVRETLLDIREKRVTCGAMPHAHVRGLIFFDEPEFWNPDRFADAAALELRYRDSAEHLSREYSRAIDAMGLREDMNFVRRIADQVGRQSP